MAGTHRAILKERGDDSSSIRKWRHDDWRKILDDVSDLCMRWETG